jgi:FlaA1/EpsC-like NDP-sugar epimerase
MLDGKRVLVTGGTGSLGQTLVRRLLSAEIGTPAKIIVFSRDEAKQYAMRAAWRHAGKATDDVYYANFDQLIEFQIGDVRDYASVERAVRRSDVVFHAAAMKQVPTCEYFPGQAVATNVGGAENVVRAVRINSHVKALAVVSTDKACRPINVMGMTKAIQERIMVEGNLHQEHARLFGVRYGNVLESRGSVIPLFKQQIATGGPLTITLPDMTRFLLSLNSAVDTIFTAFRDAGRGEIFVPKVPSARIADIAELLIGDRDVEMIETGIRPGEKRHEILVSEDEAYRTSELGDHYVIKPQLPEFGGFASGGALDGEFSSADAVVTGQELVDLIAQATFVDPAMGQIVSAGSE